MYTRLATVIRARYEDILTMWHNRQNPPTVYPPFRLDDDLSDMTKEDIERETAVVEKRLADGITEPEGVAGLNYRLHRLKAQMAVVTGKRTNV